MELIQSAEVIAGKKKPSPVLEAWSSVSNLATLSDRIAETYSSG